MHIIHKNKMDNKQKLYLKTLTSIILLIKKHIFFLYWPLTDIYIHLFYIFNLSQITFDITQSKGTLRTRRLTLIGSRTRLGPLIDPDLDLQYTWHGPLYMGYIFFILCNKNLIKGLLGHIKIFFSWNFRLTKVLTEEKSMQFR